jgi:hypothetical protein
MIAREWQRMSSVCRDQLKGNTWMQKPIGSASEIAEVMAAWKELRRPA